MNLYLDEKIVLVTGGASGIGKTICDSFIAENAKVVSFDLSHNEESFKNNLLEIGGSITSTDDISRLKNKIKSYFGRLDILINNAGISSPSPISDLDESDWHRVIDAHMTGPFLLIKEFLPFLKESKGNIVNTASFASKRSTLYGGNIAYTASKHGILGITHELAIELAPFGIRVNAVAPGPVATEMIKAHSPEKIKEISSKVPLNRLATTEEIANAVLFLSSTVSSYTTGECFSVNGGLYID